MKLLDEIHSGYVHRRRVWVLSDHLVRLFPDSGNVLDVGCGDGVLAKLIAAKKPDVSMRGIDVLVRQQTAIPVSEFNGTAIPFADASFEAVMLIDVLHHTTNPLALLREARRVSKKWILLKDHTLNGWLAGPTLRFMDRVGNRRHNVLLPHNYWPRERWLAAFQELDLRVDTWITDLGLYPPPAGWIFERSLHFIARLTRGGGGLCPKAACF
jgi:SAM-dependent methyltransferase